MDNMTYMQEKYTIEGRFMDGVKVLGYYLSTSQGRRIAATAEQVKMLALNRKITNCTAQRCGDEIRIKGDGVKLSKLPVVQRGEIQRKADKDTGRVAVQKGKFAMVGRYMDGKNIQAYKLTDGVSNYKVSRAKVMAMAKAGDIVNARVQMDNGKEILRGAKGQSLRELPIAR